MERRPEDYLRDKGEAIKEPPNFNALDFDMEKPQEVFIDPGSGSNAQGKRVEGIVNIHFEKYLGLILAGIQIICRLMLNGGSSGFQCPNFLSVWVASFLERYLILLAARFFTIFICSL